MAIRTTLHLNRNALEMLDRQAKALGMTRPNFIVLLAHRLMNQCKNLTAPMRIVRYQKRNPEAEWKTVHVSLSERDYCFLVEMRCLYKFSVSALITRAIIEYEYIQNNISNKNIYASKMDNNYYYGHGLIVEKLKNVVCWRIFWNIPKNPKKIFAN